MHIVIASADFASGDRFEIHQIVKQTIKQGKQVDEPIAKFVVKHFLPVNPKTGVTTELEIAHSNEVDACWRSIRYAAQIGQISEHSPGVVRTRQTA